MDSLPGHQPALVRMGHQDPRAAEELSLALRRLLARRGRWREAVIVCIGTDRSTGDSLGPLTGLELVRQGYPQARVYGTIDEPVHAANLDQTADEIHRRHPRATVIAVDACLGQPENVGSITVTGGPLVPGAGVNKELRPVGQVAVTGVVNVAGFMEYFVLQNTRLSLVMSMARVIAAAILDAVPPVHDGTGPAGGGGWGWGQDSRPGSPWRCACRAAATQESSTCSKSR